MKCDWRHGINGFQVGICGLFGVIDCSFRVPNWSPIRLGYLFARSPLPELFGEVMKRRLVAGLAAIVAATATILTASGAAAATPDVTAAVRRAPPPSEAARGHPGRRNADTRSSPPSSASASRSTTATRRRVRLPRAGRRAAVARGSGGDPRQGPVLGELRRLARRRLRLRVPTSVPGVHGSDEECSVAEGRRHSDAEHPVCSAMSRSFSGSTRAGASRPREHARAEDRGRRLHRQLRVLGEEVRKVSTGSRPGSPPRLSAARRATSPPPRPCSDLAKRVLRDQAHAGRAGFDRYPKQVAGS